MSDYPMVSIIIITTCLDKKELLTETIQSALNQKYNHIEIIVNEYPSKAGLMQSLYAGEEHLKPICCNEKYGYSYAKNASINEASGELVSFLRAGDKYHPDKILEHVKYRNDYPDVVLTYNAHYITDGEGGICFQSDLGEEGSFIDYITRYPNAYSDMVLTRKWVIENLPSDIYLKLTKENLEFCYLLATEKCKTAGINRSLDYHQSTCDLNSINSIENIENLVHTLDELSYFSLCQSDVRFKKNIAISRIYLHEAMHAFFQKKTLSGQELIKKAIQYDHTLLEEQAKLLLEQLIIKVLPCTEGFEPLIGLFMDQLPGGLKWMTKFQNDVIANGYFLRGIADILWNRPHQIETDFKSASLFEFKLDNNKLMLILRQITIYELEFGSMKAQKALQCIGNHLTNIGMKSQANWLLGTYYINRAFKNFQNGKYNSIPGDINKSIVYQPTYILNRGVLSILLRSYVKVITH